MNQFHARLRKKIEELKASKTEFLIRGQSDDYAKYRELVGYLQALEGILVLCDETEKDMNES